MSNELTNEQRKTALGIALNVWDSVRHQDGISSGEDQRRFVDGLRAAFAPTAPEPEGELVAVSCYRCHEEIFDACGHLFVCQTCRDKEYADNISTGAWCLLSGLTDATGLLRKDLNEEPEDMAARLVEHIKAQATPAPARVERLEALWEKVGKMLAVDPSPFLPSLERLHVEDAFNALSSSTPAERWYSQAEMQSAVDRIEYLTAAEKKWQRSAESQVANAVEQCRESKRILRNHVANALAERDAAREETAKAQAEVEELRASAWSRMNALETQRDEARKQRDEALAKLVEMDEARAQQYPAARSARVRELCEAVDVAVENGCVDYDCSLCNPILPSLARVKSAAADDRSSQQDPATYHICLEHGDEGTCVVVTARVEDGPVYVVAQKMFSPWFAPAPRPLYSEAVRRVVSGSRAYRNAYMSRQPNNSNITGEFIAAVDALPADWETATAEPGAVELSVCSDEAGPNPNRWLVAVALDADEECMVFLGPLRRKNAEQLREDVDALLTNLGHTVTVKEAE